MARQAFVMKKISHQFENSTCNTFPSRASKYVKVVADCQKTACGGHLVFKMREASKSAQKLCLSRKP